MNYTPLNDVTEKEEIIIKNTYAKCLNEIFLCCYKFYSGHNIIRTYCLTQGANMNVTCKQKCLLDAAGGDRLV